MTTSIVRSPGISLSKMQYRYPYRIAFKQHLLYITRAKSREKDVACDELIRMSLSLVPKHTSKQVQFTYISNTYQKSSGQRLNLHPSWRVSSIFFHLWKLHSPGLLIRYQTTILSQNIRRVLSKPKIEAQVRNRDFYPRVLMSSYQFSRLGNQVEHSQKILELPYPLQFCKTSRVVEHSSARTWRQSTEGRPCRNWTRRNDHIRAWPNELMVCRPQRRNLLLIMYAILSWTSECVAHNRFMDMYVKKDHRYGLHATAYVHTWRYLFVKEDKKAALIRICDFLSRVPALRTSL
jgi:hypothetical protein